MNLVFARIDSIKIGWDTYISTADTARSNLAGIAQRVVNVVGRA
jgi:hypothetical protein